MFCDGRDLLLDWLFLGAGEGTAVSERQEGYSFIHSLICYLFICLFSYYCYEPGAPCYCYVLLS